MQRVPTSSRPQPVPIALHGGTGMTDAQFTDLISRGCAKINISTALKMTFMQSNLAHLEVARARDKWDPPSLFNDVRGAVMEMAAKHISRFGSVGQGLVNSRSSSTVTVCCPTPSGMGTSPRSIRHLPSSVCRCIGARRSTGRSFESAAGRNVWRACSHPSSSERLGWPKTGKPNRSPSCVAQAQDRDLYRAGRSRARLARPARRGTDHCRRPRRGLGTRGGLDLGRAVGTAILDHVVGHPQASRFSLVLAGDVVAHKKPAPDIYELAIKRLGADPTKTLVVEDSGIGLRAARGAGLSCLITVNGYTADEDFGEAALVVSSLGDIGGEATRVLANRTSSTPGDFVTLGDMEVCMGVPSDMMISGQVPGRSAMTADVEDVAFVVRTDGCHRGGQRRTIRRARRNRR